MAVSYLAAHAWPLAFALGMVTMTAIYVLLTLLGFKPRSAKVVNLPPPPKPSPKRLQAGEVPVVPEAEMFQKLWIQWELVQKYAREGFPQEEAAARQRLEHLSGWPAIAEYACRLFGHDRFSQDTWDRLERWLLADYAADREAMLRLSRQEIAALLRASADTVSRQGAKTPSGAA